MDRWVGKTAVVTGASAGVGYATAELLVKNGMKVVGLARRVEKIEELKIATKKLPGELYALKADITKEEDIKAAFDWVKKNLGAIHVLVNNAGILHMGKLMDGDPAKWRNVFDLNVIGLSMCTMSAIQLMKETGVNDGHIININSVVGHRIPVYDDPRLNVYPASKFAVTALSETLRQELRHIKSNIKVTSLSPGYIKTEFALSAVGGQMTEELEKLLANRPGLTGEDVANSVVTVLSTPPHVQIEELIVTAI